MKNKGLKQIAVEISLNVGQPSDVINAPLYNGTCIGLAFFLNSGTGSTNIGVRDGGGTDVLDAVHYKDYEKGNIGGLAAYKPCHFISNPQTKIVVSRKDSARTFSGQMIFIIQTI